MLKEILNIFLKKGIKDIVCTEDMLKSINNDDKEHIKEKFNVQILNDLRSATFFANGEVNACNEPVILILKGDFLPNIYTGITEAWFQRSNINIISLFEEYDDIKIEYLERCIPNIITIYDDNIEKYKNKVLDILNNNMPSLINIKYNTKLEKKIDYGDIINILNNCVDNKIEVFTYNGANRSNKNIEILNIEPKYKYGILSKYMGYITGKGKKVLILLPYELLKIDLNIFNNRYINKNVKIVILKMKQNSNIEKWIQENKIEVIKTEKLNKNIFKKFWDLDKASVLIVEEEI